MDFEMQEEGYIAAILFDEGTAGISLGTTIAILVEDEDDVPAFKEYSEDASAPETKQSKP